MVDKLPSLNWCRFFQPSTVWLVFLPLVMDLTSRHDLFCYWNIRTGRWLKSKSSRVGIEKPSLSHQLSKTTLLSKDDFNFLPPTTFEISKNKYTIYLMLQMLISFRGNQWEMFLLVGFTYSIILWAKVMWRRTSPKYLASLICKLNIWIKLKCWNILNIVESEWLEAAGCSTPPTWLLFDQRSQSAPAEVQQGDHGKSFSAILRQAIESHHLFVVSKFGAQIKNFFGCFTKIHDISLEVSEIPLVENSLPPSQVSFTSLLGLLDATSHGSGNHVPGPAVQTLLSAWNDLDNTPPQLNRSISKAMTIQNTPPPLRRSIKKIGHVGWQEDKYIILLSRQLPQNKMSFWSTSTQILWVLLSFRSPPILSLLLPTLEMLQDLLDAFLSHLNPIHFHPSSTISHLSLTQKNL